MHCSVENPRKSADERNSRRVRNIRVTASRSRRYEGLLSSPPTYSFSYLFTTARSELRKVLFWRCLWLFCLCMRYLWNIWTDLRQIHTEDVSGPSLGRVWRSRSISTACVRFMFEKNIFALVYYHTATGTAPHICRSLRTTVHFMGSNPTQRLTSVSLCDTVSISVAIPLRHSQQRDIWRVRRYYVNRCVVDKLCRSSALIGWAEPSSHNPGHRNRPVSSRRPSTVWTESARQFPTFQFRNKCGIEP